MGQYQFFKTIWYQYDTAWPFSVMSISILWCHWLSWYVIVIWFVWPNVGRSDTVNVWMYHSLFFSKLHQQHVDNRSKKPKTTIYWQKDYSGLAQYQIMNIRCWPEDTGSGHVCSILKAWCFCQYWHFPKLSRYQCIEYLVSSKPGIQRALTV